MRWVILMLVFSGCGTKSEPEPVIRPQPGSERCEEVCKIAAAKLVNDDGGLGCDWAQPIFVGPGGGADVACEPEGPVECLSCGKWCVEQHSDGIYWNTRCIVEDISTCAEVETVCNVQ